MFKEAGIWAKYEDLLENRDTNNVYNEVSRQRQERINELNDYLRQKIVLNTSNNPYYDNSYNARFRKMENFKSLVEQEQEERELRLAH